MQVHQAKQEFIDRDTEVLVIGFEPEDRALGWLEQTGVSFPFLLDPDQKVYQAYELEKSLLRSWSPRNLWSYVVAFFQGREIHALSGDPNQLGGDFIIDQDQKIAMTYYSKDPTYRPAVDQLLEELDRINT